MVRIARRGAGEGETRWRDDRGSGGLAAEHGRVGQKYILGHRNVTLDEMLRLQADIIFSSTVSWVNLMQYDNGSETAGFNSRLHWIPQAGRELFLVLNHSLQDFDRDNTFNSDHADLTLKFNYTFRF